jgi:phage shock protein C
MRGRKFELDRRNGKLMGVCAGVANYLGVDATFVRIGFVVVTLAGAFPWTFLAYGIAAWIGRPKAAPAYDIAQDIRTLRPSIDERKAAMRDIDRRLAEVESYVTSSNTRLSREIEELR